MSALTELLPVVCVVQGIYAVLCLPAAGKDASTGGNASRDKGKMGQKRRLGDSAGGLGFGAKIVVCCTVAPSFACKKIT